MAPNKRTARSNNDIFINELLAVRNAMQVIQVTLNRLERTYRSTNRTSRQRNTGNANNLNLAERHNIARENPNIEDNNRPGPQDMTAGPSPRHVCWPH